MRTSMILLGDKEEFICPENTAYFLYLTRKCILRTIDQLITRFQTILLFFVLKNLQNFVGVFVAIIICGIMRIAIVSAFTILALLFSTLYPAMLRAGLGKKTAMAALFLGTCFD